MDGGAWRSNIISQLQNRNKHETAAFKDLVALHSRLFDTVNTLRNENLKLTLQNDRIRLSGIESTQNIGGDRQSNEKIQAMEQRLLTQQEELTSLHRRRGENAQEIITLNAKLHDSEKQLAAKDFSLSESCAVNASLRAEIQMYENNMQELQALNQMQRDEHQALQIAFAALEEKLRKVQCEGVLEERNKTMLARTVGGALNDSKAMQDENRALVERLLKFKAKDADKMNEDNDNFVKSSNPTAFIINTLGRVSFGRKGEKMRKELEEAAREGGGSGGGGGRSSSCGGGSGGSGSDDRLLDAMPYYASALPSKVALRFDAHDGEVNAVKWCPTDRLVATGGADRKVKLWDVAKLGVCENRGSLVGSNAGVMSVDFDSTGNLILGASNDFASRVWTVGDQRLRHTLTGHSGKVMAAKFLGEPSKVISGSHDRTLKIWDLRSKMCTETKFAGSSCNDLVTSDGAGSTIISGHFDKRIRFWDIRTEISANHIVLQGKITSLDLSRDCNYLLACVRDDTIQLIDLRKNEIYRSFSHESFKVGCDWSRAAFGPGGRLLAVGAADGAVLVWSTHSGKLEAVLKEHTCAVTAVSWHPQSGLLASVDRGKRAVIWGDL